MKWRRVIVLAGAVVAAGADRGVTAGAGSSVKSPTTAPAAAATPPAAAATEPVWANAAQVVIDPATADDAKPQGQWVGGPGLCPTVIIGGRFWSVATGKPAGPRFHVTGADSNHPPRLSPDGEKVAILTEAGLIAICEVKTGKLLATISLLDRAPALLGFLGNDMIMTSGWSAKGIAVWSATDGKPVRTLETPPLGGIFAKPVAASPDGRLVAVSIRGSLKIYDAQTGKSVATMTPVAPDQDYLKQQEKDRQQFEAANPSPQRRDTEAPPPPTAFDSLEQVAFSNSSKELAAVGPRRRLMVWDLTGKVVMDTHVEGMDGGMHITWLPDDSGWLVNHSSIYSLAIKQMVFHFYEPFLEGAALTPDGKRLLAYRTAPTASVDIKTLPLAQLSRSVAAALADKNAPMPLGAGVDVQMKLGALRGDAQKTRDGFTEMLERKGIKLAAGSPVKMELEYSEQTGETKTIANIDAPLELDRSTGKMQPKIDGSATGTDGTLHIKITGADGRVLLDESHTEKPDGFFTGKINDDVLRDSMVAKIMGDLYKLQVPAYMPSNPADGTLPIVMKEQ